MAQAHQKGSTALPNQEWPGSTLVAMGGPNTSTVGIPECHSLQPASPSSGRQGNGIPMSS